MGAIHVVNHEVFSERDCYLQLLNIFHRTTREWVIRREVLLRPEDVYDQAIVEETTRNLRDADFSSLVVILPVKSAQPGRVDLLVVTRDVWSLRLNTDFEWQETTLIYFTGSLSENNVLGWRKKAAVVYVLNQGNWSLGPTYTDPNVAGTRINLSATYKAYYDRATNDKEGGAWGITVNYPLFSLASRWGAGMSAWYSDRVARFYDRYGLYPVRLNVPVIGDPYPADAPEYRSFDKPDVIPDGFRRVVLPYIYRDRRKGVESSVVRSLGKRVINRFSLGYSLSYVRPGFAPTFPPVDPADGAVVRPPGVSDQRAHLGGIHLVEPVHPALPRLPGLRHVRPARGRAAGAQRLRHGGAGADLAGVGLQLHPRGRQPGLELGSGGRVPARARRLGRPLPRRRLRRRDPIAVGDPDLAHHPQAWAGWSARATSWRCTTTPGPTRSTPWAASRACAATA